MPPEVGRGGRSRRNSGSARERCSGVEDARLQGKRRRPRWSSDRSEVRCRGSEHVIGMLRANGRNAGGCFRIADSGAPVLYLPVAAPHDVQPARLPSSLRMGPQGLTHHLPISDAVAIVDVLAFSTPVVVAAARGVTVFPHRWNDDTGADYTTSIHALFAGPWGESAYLLSPRSLMALPSASGPATQGQRRGPVRKGLRANGRRCGTQSRHRTRRRL